MYFWWVTLGRQLIKSRNGKYSWLIPYANLTKDTTYHPYILTIFTLINEPRRDAKWAYFCILGLIRWLEASVQQDHACFFSKLIVIEVSMSLPSLRVKPLQTTIYMRDFGFLTSFPYNTRTLSLNVLTFNITELNLSQQPHILKNYLRTKQNKKPKRLSIVEWC